MLLSSRNADCQNSKQYHPRTIPGSMSVGDASLRSCPTTHQKCLRDFRANESISCSFTARSVDFWIHFSSSVKHGSTRSHSLSPFISISQFLCASAPISVSTCSPASIPSLTPGVKPRAVRDGKGKVRPQFRNAEKLHSGVAHHVVDHHVLGGDQFRFVLVWDEFTFLRIPYKYKVGAATYAESRGESHFDTVLGNGTVECEHLDKPPACNEQ